MPRRSLGGGRRAIAEQARRVEQGDVQGAARPRVKTKQGAARPLVAEQGVQGAARQEGNRAERGLPGRSNHPIVSVHFNQPLLEN